MKRSTPIWKVSSALGTGLLVALFLLPGLLWIFLKHLPDAHPWLAHPLLAHPWLSNRSLSGLPRASAPEPLSVKGWISGSWQRKATTFFDQNFPGREALMRGINESYFRAFRTSAWRSSTFTVGRSDAIFSTEYLNEYFLLRPPEKHTAAIAEALSDIARLCREHGVPFVLVLSPTKPDICPEWIPSAWHTRLKPGPRACDTLRRLLKEAGVPYIDSREILKSGVADGHFRAPAFALGGIHWTKESALPVANAIVESLRRQGLPLLPLEAEESTVSNTPRDSDKDVLALMNLASKWEYPTPVVRIHPHPDSPGKKPTVVFIGGSFVTIPATLMSESRQFAEIPHFTYLQKAKAVFRDGVREVERKASPKIDYGSEIFSADAVVVELNDYYVVKGEFCLSFAEGVRAHFSKPSTGVPDLPNQ